MELVKIINSYCTQSFQFMTRCCFFGILLLTACGYDVNPDPHRKGRVKSESISGGSYNYESIYCNTSIRSHLIADGQHDHETLILPLNVVTQTVSGTHTLLGGAHSHSFNIEAADLGALLRKREVVVPSSDGNDHRHNLSLKCAN